MIDQFGVPDTFENVTQTTRQAVYAPPIVAHSLPREFAPESVRTALAELDTLRHRLADADERAEVLHMEYKAVPADVQNEVVAAVRKGKSVSAAKLIDARRSKLAGAVRDAIAERDALATETYRAHSKARKVVEAAKYEWRDNVAADIVERTPEVRAKLEAAIAAMESALGEANAIRIQANACHVIDTQWIEQRADGDNYRAVPEVFADDQARRAKYRNTFAGNSAPVDIIGEARRRVSMLASLSNGGTLNDALAVPLASHPPVEPRQSA